MTDLTVDTIHASLKTIQEPLRNKDIVSLGLIKNVTLAPSQVEVVVELPTPVYRFKRELGELIRQRVSALGASQVQVTWTSHTLPGNRGLATRLPSVKNVIAVAAGKGGVGKSTVAANLAMGLQLLGAKVGILDADVYGPSMPTMMGEPDRPPSNTPDQKIIPAVYHGVELISVGFFTERHGSVVWRGPMVHKLLQQFLEDVQWGELDYLVVDLPPGTGDAQLSLSQLIPITGAVVVTTPQEIALIDVEKAVDMFRKVEIPILGVVENMSYYACPNCGHQDEIFSHGGGKQLAERLHTTFLGEVPIDARIRYGADMGYPIVMGQRNGELAKLFSEMALRVTEVILQMVSTGPKRPAGLVQIR